MRVAYRGQHVAGTRLDVPDRELGGGQQLEGVQVLGADVGFRQPWAERQEDDDAAKQRARRNRWRIANCHQRQQRRGRNGADEDQASGHPQPTEPDVERHAKRARPRHTCPQAHQRREPDEQRHPDADGVGVRDPRHAAATSQHDDDRRRGGEIGRVCVGAEPRMLLREPLGEPVRGCEAPHQDLRVRKRSVGGREQQQDGCDGDQDPRDAARPGRSDEVLAKPGERRGEPQRLCARRHQQHVQKRERHGNGQRENRNDRAGAPEGLDPGGLVLVRTARERIPAAQQRYRNGERDERGQGCVREPPAGAPEGRRVGRQHRIERDVMAHNTDRAPHDDSRENADAHPHAARDQARRQVLPHPRAQPQHAQQHDCENTGDLFEVRRAVAGQPATAATTKSAT